MCGVVQMENIFVEKCCKMNRAATGGAQKQNEIFCMRSNGKVLSLQ
jgi:hypothetical protein